MKYFLLMDYGSHKLVIEVSKIDFFDWIDELSSEFDIYRSDVGNGYEYYYIIDYCGYVYYFGQTIYFERSNNE